MEEHGLFIDCHAPPNQGDGLSRRQITYDGCFDATESRPWQVSVRVATSDGPCVFGEWYRAIYSRDDVHYFHGAISPALVSRRLSF
jgi:hypothetical protein